VLLRLATMLDLDAIAALHAANYRLAYRGALRAEFLAGDLEGERRHYWHDRLRDPSPKRVVEVLELSGRCVGFSCTELDDSPEWGSKLANLHVEAARQGRGLGTRLLRAVADRCATRDGGLYWWVVESNAAARRFYRGLGAPERGVGTWDAPDGGRVPWVRYAWTAAEARAFAARGPAG
jgi:hypothetical protein